MLIQPHSSLPNTPTHYNRRAMVNITDHKQTTALCTPLAIVGSHPYPSFMRGQQPWICNGPGTETRHDNGACSLVSICVRRKNARQKPGVLRRYKQLVCLNGVLIRFQQIKYLYLFELGIGRVQNLHSCGMAFWRLPQFTLGCRADIIHPPSMAGKGRT